MTFPKILWEIFWCVFCKHLGTMEVYNCFQLNSSSSTKAMNSGKNVKIRDFHYCFV